MGAIQKHVQFGAASGTRTRCRPSSIFNGLAGSSPLKRKSSRREPDSKKRSVAPGARKLIHDFSPNVSDRPVSEISISPPDSLFFGAIFRFSSQAISQPCGAGPKEKRFVSAKFGENLPSLLSAAIEPSRKSSASCGDEDFVA